VSFNATGTPPAARVEPRSHQAVDGIGVGHGLLGGYRVETVQVGFEISDAL